MELRKPFRDCGLLHARIEAKDDDRVQDPSEGRTEAPHSAQTLLTY